MPVLENSIGGNQFFDLTGAIFYRHQQLEIINRAGIAGSGVRRLGERGQPFVLVSTAYGADWAAALAAIQAYDNLVGQNPQTLIRNGTNHGTYLVLEVLEIETRAVLNTVGVGIPTTHEIRQMVRWKLLG